MKTHPFRGAQVGRNILRDRIVSAAEKSPNGQRVVAKCQATLDRPPNQDWLSRRIVIARYADELDLFPHEMESLLSRAIPKPPKIKAEK